LFSKPSVLAVPAEALAKAGAPGRNYSTLRYEQSFTILKIDE
jgi:hypothetical protein